MRQNNDISHKIINIQACAQLDFELFCRILEPKSETLQSLLSSFHGKKITKKLTELADGKIKKLIINLPPRHGKTYLEKLFLSWVVGREPELSHILITHTAKFSEKISGEIRDKINTLEFQEIFSNVRLSEDTKAKAQWKIKNNGKNAGELFSAGVDGAILGRGVSGIAVIDDPIAKKKDARNSEFLKNQFEWYRVEFESRLDSEEVRILIVQQRWAEDDLCGKLLEEEGDEWEVLKLPIIYENKTLWPERFSLEKILKRKERMSLKWWNALYMQDPDDSEDKSFQKIKYYQGKIDWSTLKEISYFDPAWGGKDHCCYIKAAQLSQNIILITHGMVWQGSIDYGYSKLKKQYANGKERKRYIESNSKGEAYMRDAKLHGYEVKGIEHGQNKFARIDEHVRKNWHEIYFIKSACTNDFIDQIRNYKDPDDWTKKIPDIDAVDGLAGIIECMHLNDTGGIEQWL